MKFRVHISSCSYSKFIRNNRTCTRSTTVHSHGVPGITPLHPASPQARATRCCCRSGGSDRAWSHACPPASSHCGTRKIRENGQSSRLVPRFLECLRIDRSLARASGKDSRSKLTGNGTTTRRPHVLPRHLHVTATSYPRHRHVIDSRSSSRPQRPRRVRRDREASSRSLTAT